MGESVLSIVGEITISEACVVVKCGKTEFAHVHSDPGGGVTVSNVE